MADSLNGQGATPGGDVTIGSSGRRLRFDVVAAALQLSLVRRRVALWIASCGEAVELVEDLAFAVNEAVTNSVEHAYRGKPGRVWIDAQWLPAGVSVDVIDTGRWRPPSTDPTFRGRGLLLLGRLADVVEVRHGETGTRVHMQWHLPR